MRIRIRNTKNVRAILRVEHPESGVGVYQFMWVNGARRSKHPAAYCPAPCNDAPIVAQMRAVVAEHLPNINPRATYTDLLMQEFLARVTWPQWQVNIRRHGQERTGPWYFGVPNMAAYRAWFSTNSRRQAHAMGLVLSVYEAHPSAVLVGETQCMFFMPAARRVAMYPVPQ